MPLDLRSCPFCGGRDIRRDDDGFPCAARCEDCGAAGGASEDSWAEAIAAWNRRFPDSELVEALADWAGRIEIDGTPSQVVSAEEIRALLSRLKGDA